ncbi:nitroreductase/quinone reductase family protein [Streptomyces albireticuli]|uniref:Nitroreductase family deazaflavin-dependent oxidoreductase n=1 Tax=Streptomyces albireticuli TaxID=1940 RepID=A0A2A2D688_9ACTN|nr:nitroreductase/quinone reductase family protein [Streptomyces albireticuli]MCD9144576.1 nitroreductase family deazaflavin-dependent oxidoreductase [Streptomyces albireticuli]MCD9163361.1 nitroreductase family deazaflavin-dependent oxidoreductase [Streptomyces albireticuli]MCD9193254.1 nitroreductase family deazaflavin-dependent oxidoreductase [Streptomyces albireticuli]PAU47998.1 nitroreductase family deazaflavin-dependent oxidoreductase [Streptomyces albireticuli]
MTNTAAATADSPSAAPTAPAAPSAGGNPFNLRVIEEFRANAGRVGGRFAGVKLLLLTTLGARSGLPRTTPLVHLEDGAGRLVVFASNGGSPTAPAWFHNLTASPEAIVEVGAERRAVRARLVDEAEHDALWARQIAVDPAFADFRERALRAGRTTPLVALEPVTPSH